MPAPPIAIRATGMVTAAGLSAPAACAAIRAKVGNPSPTHFRGSDGEPLMAHQVPLAEAWRGRARLRKMLALAVEECLDGAAGIDLRAGLPMLLCVAERGSPGRLDGLDDRLFFELEEELGMRFHPGLSGVIPQGRVGAALALAQARKLLFEQGAPAVLIAAADSLLHWPTLAAHEEAGRLLAGEVSDGFLPGEAAAALLACAPDGRPALACQGLGFGAEPSAVDPARPLRADGLTMAIRAALTEAERVLHELDFRIADLSGEQVYFKEAALALARTLTGRKEAFDLWHPAESVGETGAASGAIMLAFADAACRKAYAPGNRLLLHMAADGGRRAAIVAEFGATT
jgi:3-oxoacyl-[acyl-carrier-protein] synthase-1